MCIWNRSKKRFMMPDYSAGFIEMILDNEAGKALDDGDQDYYEFCRAVRADFKRALGHYDDFGSFLKAGLSQVLEEPD